MNRSGVAVVVIGRNEGDRLGWCLASVGGWRTIYVDSGSDDGSADRARAAGAEVIELDRATGFSAARGRNAGLDRVIADPAISHIQMVDGDSALDSGWIAAGVAALDANPGLGAVFGGLRERDPAASIYNWMCDLEWAASAGRAETFGGIVLLRAAAVRTTGGYSTAMIAGEDFDFALRLRSAGWRIACLPEAMAIHDASLGKFAQWWRRAVRHGHAVGQLDELHHRPTFARQRRRIIFWGGCVTGAGMVGLSLAALIDRRWLLLTAIAALLLAVQVGRVWLREGRRHGTARGLALALFLAIGKYAELGGLLRYRWARWRGLRPELIEYKRR